MWSLLLVFAVGYLIGSVNISVIVTKYIGKKDIRKIGSGNAGGTNVVRAMGSFWGISVMVIDILKGFAFGMIARYVFPIDPLSLGVLGDEISASIAVLGVLIGNIYPCFFGFKGGKGVSTIGGAVLAVNWKLFLILFVVFISVFLISRMVSLGSVVSACAMIIAVALVYYGQPYWYILFAILTVMALMLIIRHRANIVRIIQGKENKFKLWKKD